MEVRHRRVEFDVLALGLDSLTVAGEPVLQGVLACRQPTGLTTNVSSETVLGHGRNLAASTSGVVLVVSRWRIINDRRLRPERLWKAGRLDLTGRPLGRNNDCLTVLGREVGQKGSNNFLNSLRESGAALDGRKLV